MNYENMKCPICGGDLRLIEGKYGDFLGCTNYPDCTYTKYWDFKYGKCPECGSPLVGGITYYGLKLQCVNCDYSKNKYEL